MLVILFVEPCRANSGNTNTAKVNDNNNVMRDTVVRTENNLDDLLALHGNLHDLTVIKVDRFGEFKSLPPRLLNSMPARREPPRPDRTAVGAGESDLVVVPLCVHAMSLYQIGRACNPESVLSTEVDNALK